jgi:xylan 1,4-beta-xylosidase
MARYVKIENIEVPYGKFAVCGFRVFGLGKGNKPSNVKNFSAIRDYKDRRNVQLTWANQRDATGFVIKYGIEPTKLYHNFIVYGANAFRSFLLNAQPSYYFSIAAFNDNGISSYSKINMAK